MIYLTTHIYNDILTICHTKKLKRSQPSIVPVAGINGFPAILTKSQQLVQVATVHTGKHREHGRKRQRNDWWTTPKMRHIIMSSKGDY